MTKDKAFLDCNNILEVNIDYANQFNVELKDNGGELVPVLSYLADDVENGEIIIENLSPLLTLGKEKDGSVSVYICDDAFCSFKKDEKSKSWVLDKEKNKNI
ncbi:MAG: hypothetical protein R3Y43_06380 [Alphaproteobacteria bacterium]